MFLSMQIISIQPWSFTVHMILNIKTTAIDVCFKFLSWLKNDNNFVKAGNAWFEQACSAYLQKSLVS